MSNGNVLDSIDELGRIIDLGKKVVKLVEITDEISTLEKERKNLCESFSPADYITLAKIIKVSKDSESYSLGKAYVEPMPTGEKKTYSEASVGGVSLF